MVELLVGSIFVLGQAAITQAISITNRINRVCEKAGKPPCIPAGKGKIMDIAAPFHKETALSKIAIINAVANYFKHHYEWCDDWSGPNDSKRTIKIVSELGLTPKGSHNMEHALRRSNCLQVICCPLSSLSPIGASNWQSTSGRNSAKLDYSFSGGVATLSLILGKLCICVAPTGLIYISTSTQPYGFAFARLGLG